MKAIIRAILLDADARDASKLSGSAVGQSARAGAASRRTGRRCFKAPARHPATGRSAICNSASCSLGQQPWRAPSVFNFYRPGYVPPNTAIATAKLVAPEFQLIGETSVAGYTNFMQVVIQSGAGVGADVQADYSNRNRTRRQCRCADRSRQSLPDGRPDEHHAAQRHTHCRQCDRNQRQRSDNRVYTAILLTMASPDYLVQK